MLNIETFKKFFRSESIGGFILMACIVLSLVIANSPLGVWFNHVLTARSGFENSSIHLKFSTTDWVNDGLMAIFFLLVGLEIKRELVNGELSSIKQASLPIVAAIGGMLVPALLYVMINHDAPTASGWGIPMATDIAFAIAVLTILGNKIPGSLRVFLTALAIVDDLGAIIVIAVFYTAEIHLTYLLLSALVFACQILLNRFKVQGLVWYLILGALLWYFVHGAGIHATIAGVLTALTIPVKELVAGKDSPLEKLEHILANPVNYIIVPVFAIVNTCIRFEPGMWTAFTLPLGLGIVAGLLLGKPIGIALLSWLAVKFKLANLPQGATWQQLIGVGVLAGIGFTMSIFIALLSFSEVVYQDDAKIIILCTSVVAGVCGYMLLAFGRKTNAISI
jgi:NhaA family Na+:H+ antiporter